MGLTARQRLFVQHYLIHKNAKQAAIAAKYSKKTAEKIGSENLSKPDVRRAIEAGLSKQLAKAELTADMVLAEIRSLAFADASKLFDSDGDLLHPQDMPAELAKCLSSVEVESIFARRAATTSSRIKVGELKKVKLWDKVRALEMLAKHFKLLTDMHEISGKDGAPVVVAYIPDNGRAATTEVKTESLPTEVKTESLPIEVNTTSLPNGGVKTGSLPDGS